jgi:hypothetical protein
MRKMHFLAVPIFLLLCAQTRAESDRAPSASQVRPDQQPEKSALEKRDRKPDHEKPSGASPEASHDLFQLLKTAGEKKGSQKN